MSTPFSDTSKQQTFQLKGTMLAITVFELAHFNIERLTQELAAKVKEAPEFFGTIPMVLGIDKLDVPLTKAELKGIVSLFKEYHVQLMALRTDDKKAITTAHQLGLVVLPPAGAREKLIEIAVNRPPLIEETSVVAIADEKLSSEELPVQEQQQLLTEDAEQLSPNEGPITVNETPEQMLTEQTTSSSAEINQLADEEPIKDTIKIKQQLKSAMIISTPIRSGQQITAHDCDLVITSNISTGAELMADGNIHIYGTMRGRAMAGYKGNSNARVFCSTLTAELISIAGQMITEEELRHHPLWGKPAVLSLKENQITITPLT